MSTAEIPAGPKGFVELNGERIYFESWGSGDAVVLSHGMGGNHAIWYQQVPVLAAHYRVVTWDQRGFGRSTNNTDRLGPEPSVGDLTRLLDHLEIERCHLVGQSMGGWASLGFALENPDRTISVVLADTTGGIFTPSIRQALLGYTDVIATSPPPEQLPLGRHPAVGPQLVESDLARSFLYGQIGGLGASPSPLTIAEHLNDTDHTRGLGRFDLPLLFVVGEEDPIFPPKLIREAAELIPRSEVVVIAHTGHSPYFERPDHWNDVVLGFLQRSG